MVKRIILITIIVIAVFVLYSYGKVEVLTWRHGDEFRDGYKQTQMINRIEYLKVINYSDTSAKVLYVGQSANYVWFKRQNDEWVMETWGTVWSKEGSADGLTWPPYF